MIRIATLLTLLLGCLLAWAEAGPDPKKGGSHTHLLSYSLIYKAPGKSRQASFVATLTNISNRKLKVQVNSEKFHAALQIRPKEGDAYTAYDKGYRDLLLDATWMEPVVELAPMKTIVWNVPITSLLTLHGGPVTHESVQGCKVVSEMNMAIVPADGNYRGDNAAQRSSEIHIPKEGEQDGGGQPATRPWSK